MLGRMKSAPPAVRPILITCPKGLPPFLQEEVRQLGFPVRASGEAFVETEGILADTPRLNLWLRTGHRVLYRLAEFPAASPDELYRQVTELPWEAYVEPDSYVRIGAAVHSTACSDDRFASLKCKDALVDRLRQRCGRRPDTGPEYRGASIFLFWQGFRCSLYLDTTGESLARRGYRKIPLAAPMQESLAAAAILATGWADNGHFINPMCGSGTLAIEAALLGLRRAPGLLRRHFSLMSLKGFDARAWAALRAAAESGAKPALAHRIIATDISPAAVAAARQNAAAAGVERCIEFSVCDFAATPVPPGGGVVFLNPEYGERMGAAAALEPTYRRIGDFFKQQCQGYTGYVFTGNLELGKRIGLRSSRRIPFFNSTIECRLLAFTVYAGTHRPPRSAADQERDGGDIGAAC